MKYSSIEELAADAVDEVMSIQVQNITGDNPGLFDVAVAICSTLSEDNLLYLIHDPFVDMTYKLTYATNLSEALMETIADAVVRYWNRVR